LGNEGGKADEEQERKARLEQEIQTIAEK